MRKIFESPINSTSECGEVGEIVRVFALESEAEFFNLDGMTYDEKLEFFNVRNHDNPMPGGLGREYSFDYTAQHCIVYEKLVYNV